MWDPQRLTTLWVSMACYRDSFTFLLLCTAKVSYYIHKSLQLYYAKSQINQTHMSTHIFKNPFRTLLPFKPRSRNPVRFSSSDFVCTYHKCWISNPSYSPWFNHLSNVWWRVNLKDMTFPLCWFPSRQFFLPRRSTYSPHHSLLKDTLAM
jgi:hypothetical protein